MAFRSGSWAKVWEIEDKGNFKQVQISTSKKDKDGNYQTDFNGFVNLYGGAAEKADNIEKGDRIRILECSVTSRYIEASKKKFYNFAIFDFEFNQDKEIDDTPNPLEIGLSDEEEDMPF